MDVADGPATEATIAEVAKRVGRLDILVSNAGVSIDGLLLRLKDEDLDKVLGVNLKGSIACARAAIKVMMPPRTARIVASSVGRRVGNAGQTLTRQSQQPARRQDRPAPAILSADIPQRLPRSVDKTDDGLNGGLREKMLSLVRGAAPVTSRDWQPRSLFFLDSGYVPVSRAGERGMYINPLAILYTVLKTHASGRLPVEGGTRTKKAPGRGGNVTAEVTAITKRARCG